MSEKNEPGIIIQDGQNHDQNVFKWIVTWSITLLLITITWMIIPLFQIGYLSFGVVSVLLIVLCGAVTFSLDKSLRILNVSSAWRYRFAFLIAASTILFSLFISKIFLNQLEVNVFENFTLLLILIVISIFSAFAGGLAATAVECGLWENNSPPSKQIESSVLNTHIKIIGVPGPEPLANRVFDYILAISAVVLTFPIWAFISLIIWLERPGPILFIKNSVTKGGRNFHQYKFRTMTPGAEMDTGPVLSQEGDNRVLNFGRILRKTALDELPQLVNILSGEMSFVGPRPQRTVLVEGYLQVLPEYANRHKVLPGLSGLAQVAGDYYLTPRQKLRFDLLYIRYRSLGFDIKLLFLAFMIAFFYRWQKDWDGRLPRRLLRFGVRKNKRGKLKVPPNDYPG